MLIYNISFSCFVIVLYCIDNFGIVVGEDPSCYHDFSIVGCQQTGSCLLGL